MSLIYGLVIILLLSSSSQSYCEQGDRTALAALLSLQSAAPMFQNSVLVVTKEGNTSLFGDRAALKFSTSVILEQLIISTQQATSITLPTTERIKSKHLAVNSDVTGI